MNRAPRHLTQTMIPSMTACCLLLTLIGLQPAQPKVAHAADEPGPTVSSQLADMGDPAVVSSPPESFEPVEFWEEASGHSCGHPACRLCPCGYGSVEGLILDRDNRSAARPLVLDVNTDEVLLSTEDLNFDTGGGVRALVGHRVLDCWAVEFGYLGVFEQSTDARASRIDSLRLPGELGLAVNNFLFADQVDVHYESRLHSAEANLVRCCTMIDECSPLQRSREWLVGFRYLNLGEQIDVASFDSAESTSTYSAKTDNNLFGVQLGTRWRWCRDRWSWETTGKAGIFGNDVRQSQAPLIDFPDFVFRTARSSSGTRVAFVGELNLTGIYQLTDCWGLRAGYNLLWIEGLALAPDQIDFTNIPTSGTALVAGNGAFYHGVNVGLEGRW